MERLHEARAGSTRALGEVLEACRLYMLGIAERELDPLLRAKAGASDLVQQTFLEAQRDFGQFHGGTEDELLAWLRRLLLNNLANFARQYRGTHKRAVNREVRLPGQNIESTSGANIAGAEPTPSSAFQRDEQYEALSRALARLPDEYRQVIAWRYEEDLSFDEIGARLGRTANAARKLWVRAIERLEGEMERPT
jgi:RNA polymerase sigma-70 factor (ECF subfamily)